MAYPNALEVCRADLFTNESELRSRLPDAMADKVLRVREMYNWMLANPEAPDREFISEVCQRHDISKVAAYSDLRIVKDLLPTLHSSSREHHRWKFNEMILETYRLAKRRKDTRIMEKAAADYAKYNRVDLDDEKKLPYDMIVVQPFTATSDPRVLGIEPIPNLQDRIDALLRKYKVDNSEIEDVDFEDVDLEFNELYPTEKKSDSEDNVDRL